MGIAILSGVFTSLQSRPLDPQTPTEPVSGFSTPTQSFSLSAPEASLPSGFIATVGREETVRKLSKTLNAMEYVQSGRAGKEGIQVLAGPESNLEAVKKSDVILLCCKPQMVAGILTQQGMAQALEGKMVISICAGVRMEQLKELCPSSTVCLRAMPNTPSKASLYRFVPAIPRPDTRLTTRPVLADRRRDDGHHPSTHIFPTHLASNPPLPLHPLWTSPFPRREAFRRVYRSRRVRSGFRRARARGHGRWRRDDGSATSRGFGVGRTESVRGRSTSVRD